ncbi:EC1118_1E8_0507p [Saccharomyces cerevisiae EC1118]|uniref:Putative uncharacterized protein YEL032C-A n=2 Tax=Saccharomyces cerevisiae TaxID=4932 RepID=YE032_YEAST|nr:RecName: Full=Putative uncharacterized protein YEL032C-A [Saccharomyces cerevisiae S288C]AAL79257.1 unknown [Saccharomyces cerevisiae]WNV72373.1 hypothetical protein O6U65_0668 [Saccharomyces cerevisiae synthetic construct]CAY79130.1 EC1118_1E8_0507p [Saccharomyces cerevisiae EC1118]
MRWTMLLSFPFQDHHRRHHLANLVRLRHLDHRCSWPRYCCCKLVWTLQSLCMR